MTNTGTGILYAETELGSRALCKRDAHAFRNLLKELGAEIFYIEECNQWTTKEGPIYHYDLVKQALYAGCKTKEDLHRTEGGLRDSGVWYAHTGCTIGGNVMRIAGKLRMIPLKLSVI